MSEPNHHIYKVVKDYESYLKTSFQELWSKVPIEPGCLEAFSVIGGLLSRQVTLSIQLARSPGTWNGHSAPLFLRAQTDLHITLAWILGDLQERAKKYVLHGLGEEKLIVEHYKKEFEDTPDGDLRAQIEELIEAKTQWIRSQRHDWFIEVNLGHWANLDTWKMANEASCESLYKFAYKPFSQAAHSMWPHISTYNSKQCSSPLHKFHLVPDLVEVPLDPDYLYRSCKYVDRTYEVLLNNFGLSLSQPMPLAWWETYFADTNEVLDEERH